MKILAALFLSALIVVARANDPCADDPAPPTTDCYGWGGRAPHTGAANADGVFVCDLSQFPVFQILVSGASGTDDDAEAYAECPTHYSMVGCRCSSTVDGTGDESCDSEMVINTANELTCRARNMYGGQGVLAEVKCVRQLLTCSSCRTGNPVAGCPPLYTLISCQAQNDIRHNSDPRSQRVHDTDNALCRVSGDCYDNNGNGHCIASARCIRTETYDLVGLQ